MEKVDLVVRIGGESGEGIISAGEILTMACARAGFNVFTFRSYPAEVRGGHSMFQMRAANFPIFSAWDEVHILVALNQEAYDRHYRQLQKGGILIYDPAETQPHSREDLLLYAAPFKDLTTNQVQAPQAKNIVVLGIIAELFSMPIDKLQEIIREKFGRKGQAVLEKDLFALKVGADYAREHLQKKDPHQLGRGEGEPRLVLSGNMAITLGALMAGCRFFAGYPITPATDILETMMVEMPKLGGVSLQVEDEISALAMVIGASFAGKKGMTATSGPGLSLMTELIGLAAMTELPAVIIDVQRGGPATGIPTKTEQGDLFASVFGGHGDAPRVVLAPCTVEDCFYQTIRAFNLAERTQGPVLVLSDQALAQRFETMSIPDFSQIQVEDRLSIAPEDSQTYQRYRITDSGVSPMGIPGMPGAYIARGLEHDGGGLPNYEPTLHEQMQEKRFHKLNLALDNSPLNLERWGNPASEIGIISWGSTEGAIRETVRQCGDIALDVLMVKLINPLPTAGIAEFLKGKKKVIVPEVNYHAQFTHLLRTEFLFNPIPLRIYGGRPFMATEIVSKVKEVA
ncbi:MAG: 2-oxoacid:acceptor oxidoreductase subunit alpha [bacterium]